MLLVLKPPPPLEKKQTQTSGFICLFACWAACFDCLHSHRPLKNYGNGIQNGIGIGIGHIAEGIMLIHGWIHIIKINELTFTHAKVFDHKKETNVQRRPYAYLYMWR